MMKRFYAAAAAAMLVLAGCGQAAQHTAAVPAARPVRAPASEATELAAAQSEIGRLRRELVAVTAQRDAALARLYAASARSASDRAAAQPLRPRHASAAGNQSQPGPQVFRTLTTAAQP